MTEPQTTPPGWYPDPQVIGGQRYWDGQGWTQHTATLSQGSYQEPAKKKLSTGAVVAIVVGGVVLLLGLIVVLAAVAIPVFLNQRGEAEDAAAKADVATLGKEIATFYVDSNEPLAFYAEGGEFVLESPSGVVVRIPQSANVEAGTFWTDSSSSWCVSVINLEGSTQYFRYSALNGLEPGSC